MYRFGTEWFGLQEHWVILNIKSFVQRVRSKKQDQVLRSFTKMSQFFYSQLTECHKALTQLDLEAGQLEDEKPFFATPRS